METLGREGIFDDTKETLKEKEFKDELQERWKNEFVNSFIKNPQFLNDKTLDSILNKMNIEEEKSLIKNIFDRI